MPGEFQKTQSISAGIDGTQGDEIPVQSISQWKGQHNGTEKCITHFQNHFRSKPTFLARVPGRVNLIGEHIDYCGYGVFPMAIVQDVLVSVRVIPTSETPSDQQKILRLINTSEAEYPPFECSLQEIRKTLESRKPGVSPGWHMYYLCGVLGIVEQLELNESNWVNMELCVDGRVPARAGLSSSSALVCAAALATLYANKGEMSRKEIASLCAKSERYIGTQGGGMDQAIAFMATEGTAQLIEFVPQLNGEKVRLPPNAIFVIANSLVEANKAASDGYNVRVIECRLALWILCKVVGLNFEEFTQVKQLQLKLGFSFREMLNLVKKNIHQKSYQASEIADILGLDLDELKEKPLMNKISLESINLKLYQRITHVLTEAERVQEFRQICKETETAATLEFGKLLNPSEVLRDLGKLMNGSHSSLKELYECSHPQLDSLVELSQAFAHGARLTGAGWGGCVVALLEESQLDLYMKTIKKEYYKDVLGIEDVSPHVFITQPGSGATVYIL